MISSSRNPKIQRVRALQRQVKARRKEKAFVVEGVRLAEEALESGPLPQLGLFTEGLSERGEAVLQKLREQNLPLEEVSPEVMKAASATKTPQGPLLVFPQEALPIPPALDFLLILDQMRDPSNLGGILRSAAAASVQAVLLSPGSSDIYAPKVVRAGMGAHFRLPIHALGWEEIETQCRKNQLRAYLAEANAGKAHTEADLRKPLALLIGGEAEGPGEEARALAEEQLHIPMPGGGESLNAAAATAILLFEVARQRRVALRSKA